MKVEAGTIVTARVERRASFGYFLSVDGQDVLLHEREAEKEWEVGAEVEVFLYHDHQDRLAATRCKPYIVLGEFGWLEVKDASRIGVFLDNGIQKELLLPADQLPVAKSRWPRPGDRVYVQLEHDRQGRMLAVLGREEDLAQVAEPATRDLANKDITGYIYKTIAIGAFLLTEGQHLTFIHKDEADEPLRLGQRVSGRVAKVRDDGRLNITTRRRKEVSYSQDAEMIYGYLKERGGRMPYTDKTAPDVIKMKFGISKAAFKRALGKLMKERRAYQEDGWTILTEQK
ncbi:S1 RNA-binding domain-containing protein [Aneurinibacillus thermoaerophilus]|uniref:CvfB family protein n=1 Tax=Aneurinibacillus thermoaerophilus TaxID=143495 RepID=UPI002E240244|nr:S1-like domain-containing RNA-binding protein [Aneurinibacillus thermoaerophilus]